MGRNLYILAATLGVFALVSCGLAYTNVAHEPGSPGDVSLWRTTGLGLMVVAILVAIVGMLSALFEQAERRADEARLRDRERRGGRPLPEQPRRKQEPLKVSLKDWAARRRAALSGDEPKQRP